LKVIKAALESQGYSVDKLRGIIYGKTGKPLTLSKGGSIRYPMVSLHVPGVVPGRRPTYSIAAHKMMAYAIWGEEAFREGVQIRHLKDVLDIREESLTLGSATENMSDVPPEVRSRAAKAARAAQPKRPGNAKLLSATVRFIRQTVRRSKEGHVMPGELERLAKKFNVSKAVVGGIVRGVTYVED